jgi:hypothetical protein
MIGHKGAFVLLAWTETYMSWHLLVTATLELHIDAGKELVP